MVSEIWFENVRRREEKVQDRENDEKAKTRITLKRMGATEVQGGSSQSQHGLPRLA